MTRQGATLRAGSWVWLTPVVLMACTSARSVIPTMPVGSADSGVTDVGTGVIDVGGAVPDVGQAVSDAKHDAPTMAVDAQLDSGGCPAGAHVCGGQCVSNIDVGHCGQSCSPCFVPTGGGATCDGVSCGVTCPGGTKLCGSTACVPQVTSCGGDCPTGSHDCGGTCQPSAAPATCGTACTACPTPAHGVATCDGAQCGFTCSTGYHACGAQCVSSADVASCGSSCTACAVPAGGTATCDGATCGSTCPSGTKLCLGSCIATAQACQGSCPAGTHNCNGNCQSNTSANNCGTTSCTPCSAPANGVATCDGTQCGFTCSVGYHLCGSACLPNSGVASCGTTSCTACAAPANASATCDGLQCGFVCASGTHACGNSCGANTSVQTCGQSCTACPVPANGIATCNGTSCAIACNAGFHDCGGLCVSSSSVLTCGSSCTACPVPTTGIATCDGNACGASVTSFNLTVTTPGIAGATGTVTPSPAGPSCGTGCFSYAPGTSVKITATPATGALFGGWSGGCAGQGATCTLTLSAAQTAAAYFRPNKNIAFVTGAPIAPATIGSSLATADAFCVSSAKAAFLGGTVWKAWLSTSSATTNINAATHVGASTTGWIRVDGRPIATSMANLLARKIYYPIRLTEVGNDTINFAVLTGTSPDGSPVADGTCGDWTSNTGMAFVGSSSSPVFWSNAYFIAGDSCGNPFSIYCFENDTGMAAVPAPVAPSNARHAFLSTTLWTPGGGVAAADAVCQADGSASGVPNAANYRALLTTTVAATDATRISLSGQPWYRLDGAQLFVSAADLGADPTAGKILTALDLDSSGNYGVGTNSTWTGNLVGPSSTAMVDNCNNWTSSSATLMGAGGSAFESWFTWWVEGTVPLEPCNTPNRLYCFER